MAEPQTAQSATLLPFRFRKGTIAKKPARCKESGIGLLNQAQAPELDLAI